MSLSIHLKSIADLSLLMNVKEHHPLITVVDFSLIGEHVQTPMRITTDFYSVVN